MQCGLKSNCPLDGDSFDSPSKRVARDDGSGTVPYSLRVTVLFHLMTFRRRRYVYGKRVIRLLSANLLGFWNVRLVPREGPREEPQPQHDNRRHHPNLTAPTTNHQRHHHHTDIRRRNNGSPFFILLFCLWSRRGGFLLCLVVVVVVFGGSNHTDNKTEKETGNRCPSQLETERATFGDFSRRGVVGDRRLFCGLFFGSKNLSSSSSIIIP